MSKQGPKTTLKMTPYPTEFQCEMIVRHHLQGNTSKRAEEIRRFLLLPTKCLRLLKHYIRVSVKPPEEAELLIKNVDLIKEHAIAQCEMIVWHHLQGNASVSAEKIESLPPELTPFLEQHIRDSIKKPEEAKLFIENIGLIKGLQQSSQCEMIVRYHLQGNTSKRAEAIRSFPSELVPFLEKYIRFSIKNPEKAALLINIVGLAKPQQQRRSGYTPLYLEAKNAGGSLKSVSFADKQSNSGSLMLKSQRSQAKYKV